MQIDLSHNSMGKMEFYHKVLKFQVDCLTHVDVIVQDVVRLHLQLKMGLDNAN